MEIDAPDLDIINVFAPDRGRAIVLADWTEVENAGLQALKANCVVCADIAVVADHGCGNKRLLGGVREAGFTLFNAFPEYST